MENKKRVLIIYPDMIIGGSTTALLAMLQKLDYSRVSVDLQFLHNGSFRLEELPPEVKVLPEAMQQDILSRGVRLGKAANFVLTGKAFSALWHTMAGNRPFGPHLTMAVNQMLARIHCELSRPVEEEYDLAVAYLELWPTCFVAEKVKAKRKVAWCHVDYPAARLNPALDRRYYEKMDRIYCVSPACAQSFRRCFPELAERVEWMENLIDDAGIRAKAALPVEMEPEFAAYGGLRIVTVARLDSYTKGLDRVIAIAGGLKQAGLAFRWYLIGGGPDEGQLRAAIADAGVEDRVYLLGPKENPYPYLKRAGLFVLPSRNEGKPVTVAEAQILGVPILVTEYASAREQLAGSGGRVVPNDEAALAEALEDILRGKTPPEPTRWLPQRSSERYQYLEL